MDPALYRDMVARAQEEDVRDGDITTHPTVMPAQPARGRARIEISGGVTLERMPERAATGADFASVGALTHSAPGIDISCDIEPA